MKIFNLPGREKAPAGMNAETITPKPPEAMAPGIRPVGAEQLKQFTSILQKYKAGKAQTERRIVQAENWWKLHNGIEEMAGGSTLGSNGGFRSSSGWLHNVIVSKHADAMEAFPEANLLPREPSDRQEANALSHIVPCVLEQNNFEAAYSEAAWDKCKTGTCVYKVVWDKDKLNGLGDVRIEAVDLLNVFWEPGVSDIQQSRYFFQTQLVDKDILLQQYPELTDKALSQTFMTTRYQYDDSVSTEDKATVVEVYYHKHTGGKRTLQYCKYVNDYVMYATENEPALSERGLYDHGKYPYHFDRLYPIKGSPCGYGYVDVCKNPQTAIDLLNTSFVRNAMVGAQPRYFRRNGGGVNKEQFLNLDEPLIDVDGGLSDDFLRPVEHKGLDGVYVNVRDGLVQELRETSGNTETSTGTSSGGVTAASAIAALQEASGKGSRDSNAGAYRVFSGVVEMVIELIRQFYDLPRQFRILGKNGAEQFVSYSNAGLKPQHMGWLGGVDQGYRLPVFDIKVSAQRKNVYTKVSQNELALQFMQMGFFSPQMADQALACIDMMDFDGREEVMQKISRNGTMYQKLVDYMQLALVLTERTHPEMVQGISQDIMQTVGAAQGGAAAAFPSPMDVVESDNIAGIKRQEPGIVRNARERSNEAAMPEEGKVISPREDKK